MTNCGNGHTESSPEGHTFTAAEYGPDTLLVHAGLPIHRYSVIKKDGSCARKEGSARDGAHCKALTPKVKVLVVSQSSLTEHIYLRET